MTNPGPSYAGDLSWINDYVGVPYIINGRDRDGWDCWGVVLAVYRERLELELPDWRRPKPFGLAAQVRAFDDAWRDVQGEARALELEAPEPFAIGLVRRGATVPHHVGVVVGTPAALGVLHAQRYGGTVFDPVRRFAANYPGVKWFRWRR